MHIIALSWRFFALLGKSEARIEGGELLCLFHFELENMGLHFSTSGHGSSSLMPNDL